MSNTNSPFKKVPVDIQKRNGFDMSHLNFFSGKIGQLIPVLTERLMPGDRLSLGTTFRVQFPPMATDFLGKVDCNVRAFFVPLRLIYGGWKEFMMYSGGLADQFQPQGLTRTFLPTYSRMDSPVAGLLDYLGFKSLSADGVTDVRVDAPVAYHLIWNDWYRDPKVQRDIFAMGQSQPNTNAANAIAYIRGTRYTTSSRFSAPSATLPSVFLDGVELNSLRQVNYEKDYFTTAFTQQNGGSHSMSVAIDPSIDVDGGFTIPQLRSANLLQKFAERNALAGGVYQDAIKATYGVRPADGLVDRSIYLGQLRASVYNNSVLASVNSGNLSGPDDSSNPFTGQLGNNGASSKSIGSGSLATFEAKEHGIFMVLMDVSPHAVYSTGTRRYLHAEGDGFVDQFAVPALAGLGNQRIYRSELIGGNPGSNAIFGYTDRYADMKWHGDEVHGLLRAGQSLQSFALQRAFSGGSSPSISSSFIAVSTNDMDNVTAVESSLSDYGYWCDMFHSFKMSRPLPAYSIPSLECDENTKREWIDRGGRRF